MSLYDKLKKKFVLGDVTCYLSFRLFTTLKIVRKTKNVETAMMNTVSISTGKLENKRSKFWKMMIKILMLLMVGSVWCDDQLRDHPYQGEVVNYLDGEGAWEAYTTDGGFEWTRKTS